MGPRRGRAPPDTWLVPMLSRVLLCLAGAVVFSVLLPPPLVLPAMETFSFYAALGMAIMAFRGREVFADASRFNRWDCAMMLAASSVTFSLFADEAAALAYLEEMVGDDRPR